LAPPNGRERLISKISCLIESTSVHWRMSQRDNQTLLARIGLAASVSEIAMSSKRSVRLGPSLSIVLLAALSGTGGCSSGPSSVAEDGGTSAAFAGNAGAVVGGEGSSLGGLGNAMGGAGGLVTSSGGAPSYGGAPSASGGVMTSGGAPSASGGSSDVGGAVGAGGAASDCVDGSACTGNRLTVCVDANGSVCQCQFGSWSCSALTVGGSGNGGATSGGASSGGSSSGGATSGGATSGGATSGGASSGGDTSAGGADFWQGTAYNASGLPNPSNGNHNAGQDCMGCHNSGSRQWLFGGTIYQSNGSAAPSVQVGIWDGTKLVTAYSATNGNIWLPVSSGPIDWANAEVRIRDSNGERTMTGDTPSAACNSCHNSSMRITAP